MKEETQQNQVQRKNPSWELFYQCSYEWRTNNRELSKKIWIISTQGWLAVGRESMHLPGICAYICLSARKLLPSSHSASVGLPLIGHWPEIPGGEAVQVESAEERVWSPARAKGCIVVSVALGSLLTQEEGLIYRELALNGPRLPSHWRGTNEIFCRKRIKY